MFLPAMQSMLMALALACALAGAEPACQSSSMMQLSTAMETHVQVVIMIMTSPFGSETRDLFRSFIPELTNEVAVNGIPVQFVVRFGVGDEYPCYNETEQTQARNLLKLESENYGDIAYLNSTDGCKPDKKLYTGRYSTLIRYSTGYPYELSYCDNGKSWHLFQWARHHYPKASLVFKQDDDALVDWRITLPRLLASAKNQSHSTQLFRRLFLGGQHKVVAAAEPTRTCAEGQVYGFSADVLSWAGTHTFPRDNSEDLEACNWADAFDKAHPQDPVNRHGIVPLATAWLDWQAWIHPLKTADLLKRCFEDRVHGCTITGSLAKQLTEDGKLYDTPDVPIHFKLNASQMALLSERAPELEELQSTQWISFACSLCLVACLVAFSKTNSASMGESKQLPALDNARFMLMPLIIFSHLKDNVCQYTYGLEQRFEPYNPQLGAQLAHDRIQFRSQYSFGINCYWDMTGFASLAPSMSLTGFVFLSGYLGQGRLSIKAAQALVVRLLLPSLLYSAFLAPGLLWLIDREDLDPTSILWSRPWNAAARVGHGVEALDSHVEWYLQSLLTWRLLGFAVFAMTDKVGGPAWFWWMWTCIAGIAAASEFGLDLWSFQLTAIFLPVYAIGNVFPLQKLIEAVPFTLAGGALGLVGWLAAFHSSAFLQDLPFKSLPKLPPGTWPWEAVFLFMPYICSLLVSTAVFLMLVALLCPRDTTWFTHRGGQGALYVFLLHPLLFVIPYYLVLERGLQNLPKTFIEVQSMEGSIAGCLLQLLLCLGATVLLSSEPVMRLFSPVIQPTWIENMMFGPAGKKPTLREEDVPKEVCKKQAST